MKKQMLALAIATVTCFTAATAQVSFGIRGGVNFQNINGKDPQGDKLENDLKVGFHVGVNAELPLADDFFIQPGLLYTTKGTKQDQGSNVETTVNLNYLELPVNLVYKPQLGSGRLILGFGPYAALGLSGKAKTESSIADSEADVEWQSDATLSEFAARPTFKRFDYGANLLAGYEFANKLSFQINAQLGIGKINPEVDDFDDDFAYRNTGFGVSLGYRF